MSATCWSKTNNLSSSRRLNEWIRDVTCLGFQFCMCIVACFLNERDLLVKNLANCSLTTAPCPMMMRLRWSCINLKQVSVFVTVGQVRYRRPNAPFHSARLWNIVGMAGAGRSLRRPAGSTDDWGQVRGTVREKEFLRQRTLIAIQPLGTLCRCAAH